MHYRSFLFVLLAFLIVAPAASATEANPGPFTNYSAVEANIISVYRAFVAALPQAESVDDVRSYLSDDSPLLKNRGDARVKASGDARAQQAFTQYQALLAGFAEQSLAVEQQDNRAELIARGQAPVTSAQVRNYLQTATAVYRVSFIRDSEQWKISNTRYNVYFSD
ncbi:hypothetical protein [Halioxenophilus sp. WMMB6]|uniref:hypothetical protein n=1 Tax=Halioxenophilus sp. WMMB6 TaxID=3073815 RepID=UPI00295EA290|nr:hypothetical protein [Halioxenophilus sp. WMMB6]